MITRRRANQYRRDIDQEAAAQFGRLGAEVTLREIAWLVGENTGRRMERLGNVRERAIAAQDRARSER